MNEYIRAAGLKDRFGVCARTIERWIREPGFPTPLVRRRVRFWDLDQVIAWELQQFRRP
jgi:hypothetical protein